MVKNLIKIISIFTILIFSSCSSKVAKTKSLPVYGHYCGPNYPLKETNSEPIDQTDLACKNHDNCYKQNGYLNTKCDEVLIETLKSITPETEVEKAVDESIIYYFIKSPKIN